MSFFALRLKCLLFFAVLAGGCNSQVLLTHDEPLRCTCRAGHRSKHDLGRARAGRQSRREWWWTGAQGRPACDPCLGYVSYPNFFPLLGLSWECGFFTL